MPVMDRLINGSLYNDHAEVRCFSNKIAFSELRVSFLPFVMPIIHRTMQTVVKSKSPKQWALLLCICALICFKYYYKTILLQHRRRNSLLYAAETYVYASLLLALRSTLWKERLQHFKIFSHKSGCPSHFTAT